MDLTYEQAIQRLKERRNQLGSQKVLAYRLGVSEPYLSDVFNGARPPGPKILTELKLEKVVKVVYREVEQ